LSVVVDRLCELYVRDRITVEELEHRLEPVLLRQAPLGHPVPEGWSPLPECEHDWIDITTLGQRDVHEICSRCGDETWRSVSPAPPPLVPCVPPGRLYGQGPR
jgi:hypothetical protein